MTKMSSANSVQIETKSAWGADRERASRIIQIFLSAFATIWIAAFIFAMHSQAHAQTIQVDTDLGVTIQSGGAPSTAAGTDFGAIGLGNGTIRSFFIVNSSGTPLTISAPQLGGANANTGDFNIIQQPETLTIAPGTQTNFAVQFVPQATGQRTASISFTTNVLALPTFIINLQGEGTATPGSFTISGGNNQSTTVGTGFTDNLEVTLLDTNNNPISGANVTFNADAANAVNPSAIFSNNDTIISVQTDANGVASAPATANSIIGNHTVGVTTPGANNLTFNLANTSADTTNPQVTSIVRQNPNEENTNADSLI